MSFAQSKSAIIDLVSKSISLVVGKFQSLCDFDGEFFKLLALPLSNKEHVAKGNGLDPQALL
jgi:hypothetical protein